MEGRLDAAELWLRGNQSSNFANKLDNDLDSYHMRVAFHGRKVLSNAHRNSCSQSSLGDW